MNDILTLSVMHATHKTERMGRAGMALVIPLTCRDVIEVIMKMRTVGLATCILLTFVTTVLAARPAEKHDAGCTLPASVLNRYANLESVDVKHWGRSLRPLWHLIGSCPDGPADEDSRSVFFALVAKDFTVNYAQLLARPEVQSDPQFAEAFAEGAAGFQNTLVEYMEGFVGPDDLPYRRTILLYAGPKAIAHLGPAVVDEVLQASSRPVSTIGYSGHSPEEAALGALGYWIDERETRFGTSEKHRFMSVLLERLRSGDFPPTCAVRMRDTILSALGHSSDRATATAIRSWADSLADQRDQVVSHARALAAGIDVAAAAKKGAVRN